MPGCLQHSPVHLCQVVDEEISLDLISGTEVPADRTADAGRRVVLLSYELIHTFAAVVVQASDESVGLDHCLQAHRTLKVLLGSSKHYNCVHYGMS